MVQKRIIFKMFAILLTGACMAACSGSDDDNAGNVTPQPQPNPQGGKTVILTGSLSPKSSETTRSVDADGNTKWVVGEKIGIIYQKANYEKAVAEATITLIRGAQNAEFTATLTNVADGTQTVDLIYPFSLATTETTEGYNKTKLLTEQKGTIADISANWDLATGKGQMKVSGATATLPSLTLKNQLCICKFTLKNNDGKVDFNVSSFAISDGTNSYTITPTSPTNELTVALLPASGAFTFTGTSLYTKKYTYENGKPLSEVTTADIGRAIATDGKAYTMKTPLESGTPTYTLNVASATLVANRFYESTLKMPVINPVAILAYVGEETAEDGYRHGLAFALKTAIHDSDVGMISWKTAGSVDPLVKDNPNAYSTLNGALNARESGSALSSISGRNNWDMYPAFYAAINNAIPLDETSPIAALAPSESTGWFLPSIFQWNQMIKGLANTPDVNLHSNDDTSLTEVQMGWHCFGPHKGSSFNDKLSAIGGDELVNGGYYSSSEAVYVDENQNNFSRNYNYNSSFGSVGAQYKGGGSRVRAAFAF